MLSGPFAAKTDQMLLREVARSGQACNKLCAYPGLSPSHGLSSFHNNDIHTVAPFAPEAHSVGGLQNDAVAG